MQKIVKNILKLFVLNPKKLFTRQEIEENIGRRTIIRTLSLLEKEKRTDI
ncbi:hypothetical protein MNB_SV-12-261 [hydrothermal vent metagenome]|uniref:Uncharacterized protein n=1 Tax=hydrothermal vent metagenome TaxID=652676 RepID=A0A1W1C9N3_9ZZZZ